MRRRVLTWLRCPSCREGELSPDASLRPGDILFGPVRCAACQASFPVGEGVPDLVTHRVSPSTVQRKLERPWVARSYERYVRPSAQLLLARRRMDRESELVLYRALLGVTRGSLLDLACGTGLFTRRLARDSQLTVVGMDVSRSMLEEAVAQAREAGVIADFLRAEAPELPFQEGTWSAVLQSHALHFIPDTARLLREVFRVLQPGGRYVASTLTMPGRVSAGVQRRMGLHPRSVETLEAQLKDAGFARFERILMGPLAVLKAERPALTTSMTQRPTLVR